MAVIDVAIDAHRFLVSRELPHAFGGALALNYYADPRATVDVDLCVFVPWSDGLALVPDFEEIGFRTDRPIEELLAIAGIRMHKAGDPTPLDLFFSVDEVYDVIARRVRTWPFGPDRVELPFLAAEDIVLFKLSFNRPKDWVDIERVVTQGPPLDFDHIEQTLVAMRGPMMHPRVSRLRALMKANRPA